MEWAPQATPQTVEDALRMPRHPEIVTIARERGISSVVHFTRIDGLVGILDSSTVKSRRNLPAEERLKYIYHANAENRSRDLQWHEYINLSITEINIHMFNYSRQWHPNDTWVILGFSPEILGDSGVVFCTTNNAYAVVHRCAGLRGFNQMFAKEVRWGHRGDVCTRHGRKRNQTTDPQAEVLYPHELSTDHLHTITVRDGDTSDMVAGVLSQHSKYSNDIIITDPRAFL